MSFNYLNSTRIIYFILCNCLALCVIVGQNKINSQGKDFVIKEDRTQELLTQLKSSNSKLRSNAIVVLGKNKVKEAIPELIKTLNDSDPEIRGNAAIALANIEEDVDEAIPILIENLKDANPYIRVNSVIALGMLETREAIPELTKLLSDGNISVRNKAIFALGKMGYASSKAISLILPFLNDLNRETRFRSAIALSRIMDSDEIEKHPQVIAVLLEALRDSDSFIHFQSSVSIYEIEIPQNEKLNSDLISALENIVNDESFPSFSRRKAIEKLSEFDNQTEDIISFLISHLNNKSLPVRTGAITALRDSGTKAKKAVPNLVVLLSDDDVRIRKSAADALGNIEDKSAVPDLIKALNNEENKYSIINSLANIGEGYEEAIPVLIELLKDDSWNIRAKAAKALGNIKAEKAVSALITALKKEEQFTSKREMAIALGRLGSSAVEILPELNNALKIRDSKINPEDKRREQEQLIHSIAALSDILVDKEAINSLEELKYSQNTISEIQNEVLKKDSYGNLLLLDSINRINRNTNHLEIIKKGSSKRVAIEFLTKYPYIAFLAVSYIFLFFTSLFFLWLRPVWLLNINENLTSFTDFKLPEWLGGANISLRHLLLFGFFQYHPRVIDTWVSQHIDKAHSRFSQKQTVLDRNVYVPVGLFIDDLFVDEITPQNISKIFSQNQSYLVIVGEGGTGKTSLACQIAKWGMTDNSEERLCEAYKILPVLIEQDFDVEDEDSFLKVIQIQLTNLIDAQSPPSISFIKQLLKKKRILVIIDGLSELNKSTDKSILHNISKNYINTIIFTSRVEGELNKINRTLISPTKIKGNQLSSFVERYLSSLGKRELFEDEVFFDDCRLLTSLVGDRDITALLAKLFVEQMIAQKEINSNDNLPSSIPELMLKNIQILHGVTPSNYSLREINKALKIIAWECLRKDFRPLSANFNDTIKALNQFNYTDEILNHLIEKLRLLETVSFGEKIRFRIDPLCEYLAGMYIVDENNSDETKWDQFLNGKLMDYFWDEKITGFLLALRDCCSTKDAKDAVPSFVIKQLSEYIF